MGRYNTKLHAPQRSVGLEELMEALKSMGIQRLKDISKWEDSLEK